VPAEQKIADAGEQRRGVDLTRPCLGFSEILSPDAQTCAAHRRLAARRAAGAPGTGAESPPRTHLELGLSMFHEAVLYA
jgi:hypothetical protein